jgi:hypothetical protein
MSSDGIKINFNLSVFQGFSKILVILHQKDNDLGLTLASSQPPFLASA